MYNYEYRVVIIDVGVMTASQKIYDAQSAYYEYEKAKNQHTDAFVTIEMRETW